jgi:hypothetical protein
MFTATAGRIANLASYGMFFYVLNKPELDNCAKILNSVLKIILWVRSNTAIG